MIQIILLDNGIRVADIDYPNNHLVFGIERTNFIEIFDSGKKVVSAPYTEFIDWLSRPYLTPQAVIANLDLSYTGDSGGSGFVTQGQLTSEVNARAAGDLNLQNQIDSEALTRASADSSLNSAISSETSTRASADTTLQNNIDNEASARASADSTLQSNINSEASTRASADSTLQGNINSEALTRASADTTLQNNIDNETSTRASADTTLTNNLASEVTNRTNADSTLQDNITAEANTRASADTTLTNNLAAEVTNRTNADNTLQSNIGSEASTRASADTTLQNNINSEASTRASADTALGNRTTILENNEFKILYYASIGAASGAITIPTDATVILNDFPQGLDAICETIINGEPSGLSASTAGGVPITVTSFDLDGNFVLSGTPSSYPVALLYLLKIKEINYVNLTFDNIIEAQKTSAATISYVDQKFELAESNSFINALIFG